MAVLTDGNPSHEHGTETLRGVAQRVFARRSRRAAAAAGTRAAAARPEAGVGAFDSLGPGALAIIEPHGGAH
jgi:hypothetical protein